MDPMAFLEGGPADLPTRIVPLPPPGEEVKIQHRGGYEHFENSPGHIETPEGRLPVYLWCRRTEIAE
ncbi:DUF5988 family protein [Nocardia sp. NPDC004340]|uniref:DUF5988 family protein n=1 Tax=Nocardia sp. CA-136227 TaxID=3239979 RepID=UPI003D95D9AA